MARAIPPDAAVGPIERGLTVLSVLAATPRGRIRAGDLVRHTGLARSTIDRIAATLTRLGLVRVEDADLVLTPQALAFGNAYRAGLGLPRPLAPIVTRLADDLDESVSLAVPDGDGVRFVDQTPRRRALSIAFRVGDLLPAERCAPGALFASTWTADDHTAWRERRARDTTDAGFPAMPAGARERPGEADFAARVNLAARDGLAVDDQLIEPGLVAVAVPVHGPDGAITCALSVVSHTSRHTAASLAHHAAAPLRATALRMTEALAEAAHDAGRVDPRAADPTRDTTLDAKRDLGPEYLQSLARGLTVLAALRVPGGMTLAEVARATALARATTRRCLLTLREQGYVVERDGRFASRPKTLELGHALLSGMPIGDLAAPHLADLVHRIGESASLAELDGHDIRYVARAAAGRIMSVAISVGTRFPAHATSMGRVLLAELPPPRRRSWLAEADLAALTPKTITDPAHLARVLDEVHRDGYALVDQELEEGLRSIAVPVRDAAGTAVAAVNVSLHAERTDIATVRSTILPELRATAARIDADLAQI